MNRLLYIGIPVVLMVAFLFIYADSKKKIEAAQEKARIEKATEDKRIADEKEALRIRNKENADKADARRRADEAEKELKKKQEYEAGLQKIRDEEATFTADLNKYKKEIAELETELDKIRAEKEKLSRESIDLSKEIAAAYIERQNAEMEVQRYAAMVARRANDSPLARPPAVAPAQ
ncbi:hypothetical protein [Ereboglobus luteus]|uniref:Uncharacterized protein n=1 Tax=Ereboglobus luteus TaxID=1796921 RepID=A0A2U8E1X9_9BACT|nr:hypothetical protein [Ereboglobus luteus]AWI08889.1 hypothetical protein CKA38_06145 [Ereboglobus luteus]